jgi:HD-GYP domain-containing protein (c-di-GMP phosphodiesterase class II)
MVIATKLALVGTVPSPLAVLGISAALALALLERRRRRAAERLSAAALETLLNAIDANDGETGTHVRRVGAYALILAEAAGLDEDDRHDIERVALFHDVGKIHEAVTDIIHEETRLDPAERQAIEMHPARGAQVLAPLAAFFPDLPSGVLAHHERWDGRGYPRGLSGSEIPITARIVSIADTFDAVAHDRRYRRGAGLQQAFRVIASGRGTQFDPELVDLMMRPDVRHRLGRAVAGARRRGQRRDRRHGETEAVRPDLEFRWRTMVESDADR